MYKGQSSVDITALISFDGDVDVHYNVCRSAGLVEFSLGGTDVVELAVSERGLATLTEVLPRALAELRGHRTSRP